MTLYGIRDRSPYVQYSNGLTTTKQGAQDRKDVQRRYYSSIDAEIFFGNHYIDEIVQIAFQVQQNNLPLFGYNSYVYDEVALGARIISGQFTINFTSPNYLFEIMDAVRQEVVYVDESEITKANESSEDDVEQAKEEAASNEESVSTDFYANVPRGRRPLHRTTFDIDLMFGQEDRYGNAKHVLLEGVVIGESVTNLDSSGQPVTETYSFIARDIVPID